MKMCICMLAKRCKGLFAFVHTVIAGVLWESNVCTSWRSSAALQAHDCSPARSSAAWLGSARHRAAIAAAVTVKYRFPVHIPHLPSCVIVGPVREAHS